MLQIGTEEDDDDDDDVRNAVDAANSGGGRKADAAVYDAEGAECADDDDDEDDGDFDPDASGAANTGLYQSPAAFVYSIPPTGRRNKMTDSEAAPFLPAHHLWSSIGALLCQLQAFSYQGFRSGPIISSTAVLDLLHLRLHV